MTPDEVEKAVRSNQTLPSDVEQQRAAAIEAAKQNATNATHGLICCAYVQNGNVYYAKLLPNECTSFPVYGTIVADNNCN